jgi:hypothetical protein
MRLPWHGRQPQIALREIGRHPRRNRRVELVEENGVEGHDEA